MEDFLMPNGYYSAEKICLSENSYVLLKLSEEERCRYIAEEVYACTDNVLILESIDTLSSKISFQGQDYSIKNRGDDDLELLINEISSDEIFIDLTSLEIYEIPRLVRGLHDRKRLICIYAEPREYDFNLTRDLESDYDLFDSPSGVFSLPGYAILRPDNNFNFVPFLGLSGSRLTFINEHLQPLEANTFPIVGMPGYSIDLAFNCISENYKFFENIRIAKNVQYISANSPFRVYRYLKKLGMKEEKSIVVSLTGAKPQGLGAIIFAIKNPRKCDLVYDYPRRNIERFIGIGRIYFYLVSDMWDVIDSVA